MGFRTEHCTFSGWAEIQVSTSPWAPVHAGAAPLAEDVLWRVLTATREERDICGTCLLLAPRTDVHSSRLGNLSRWVSLAFSCPLVPGRAGSSWEAPRCAPGAQVSAQHLGAKMRVRTREVEVSWLVPNRTL